MPVIRIRSPTVTRICVHYDLAGLAFFVLPKLVVYSELTGNESKISPRDGAARVDCALFTFSNFFFIDLLKTSE